MAQLIQISILIITILLSQATSVTIFQGLSIKKGIDISFIPFPIKPITFIKEKWTPFGSFGVKHGIVKRQVINIIEPEVVVTPVPVIHPAYVVSEVPRPEYPPVAPVVEHHDELEIPIENIDHISPEIPLITPPVAPVVENELSVIAPVSAAVEEQVPVVPKEEVVVEVPPAPIPPAPPVPILAPPIAPLVRTPLPNNLNTDIFRATAINEYLNTVEKSATPVVAPVKENESPSLLSAFLPKGSVRSGSKLAIQLGSAFLHFMTQVFNSQ